jgi:hypothetical protein
MSFISIMKHVGSDIEKVFESKPFQVGEQLTATILGIAFPGMGPLFNLVAHNAITIEQNFAVVGQHHGTGDQKRAALIAAIGNLLDAGLKASGLSVTKESYISAVLTVLNGTPAPGQPAEPTA